jgi:hypothetical protein
MEYYKMSRSEKHLRNITGIFKISGESLDREYISQWATKLDLDEVWDMMLCENIK